MRLTPILLSLSVLAACNHVTPNDGNVEKQPPATETAATTDGDTTKTATADTQADEKPPVVVINTDNPEISNTQNFASLIKNVSIADDKARLKAQKEKFQVIAPTALPKRGAKTVNIVDFALSTTNKVGEKKYSRGINLGTKASLKNCKKFSSADNAQEAFLTAGGPKRDTKNLDPDGDGFACDWSPEPFRSIVKN